MSVPRPPGVRRIRVRFGGYAGAYRRGKMVSAAGPPAPTMGHTVTYAEIAALDTPTLDAMLSGPDPITDPDTRDMIIDCLIDRPDA